MAFRLKNKELQDKLDALADGIRFSDQLQECYEIALMDGRFDDDERFNVWFGEKIGKLYKYIAAFKQDEVEEVQEHEEVQEYNPNAWNDFPTVTPPENVPMRIEVKRIGGKDHGSTFPFYGYFKDSEWIVLIRRSFNKLLKEFSDFDPTYDKIRFRPWND